MAINVQQLALITEIFERDKEVFVPERMANFNETREQAEAAYEIYKKEILELI